MERLLSKYSSDSFVHCVGFESRSMYLHSDVHAIESVCMTTASVHSLRRCTWKLWRPCQWMPNPCNFLIWMHVELLPNRTRSGDQRQGEPWGFLPAPVRLKFGFFGCQVAPMALSCSCCATTRVSSCSINSRPGRGTLLLGVSLTLLHLTALPKPRADRPDIPTHGTKHQHKHKHMPKPEGPLRPERPATIAPRAAAPLTQAPNAEAWHIGTHPFRHVPLFFWSSSAGSEHVR